MISSSDAGICNQRIFERSQMVNLRVLSIIFCALTTAVSAQYTQVGQGGFANYSYGPMATIDSTPFFNRHAYIYPSASITPLLHGDTIRSLEFMRTGNDTLVGQPMFRIYMRSCAKANFGSGSINWKAEARDSGLTKVFEGNPGPYMGNQGGFVRFDFNEVDYLVFDTSGGAVNLEILVEYTQQVNQINPIAWMNESAFYVPGFVSSNETKLLSGGSPNWNDSMSTGSSQIKPTLRINHPRHAKNLEVRNIYALGTASVAMGTPDTIKAIIENIGSDSVFNHKVYLTVQGANSFEDSLIISVLAPFEETLVRFDKHETTKEGNETLVIELDEDDDLSDNINSINRRVTYSVMSHCDPFQANTGGVGFSGSTGDFVARFHVDGQEWINQIQVDFNSTGRFFQLGVWDNDGPNGLPGTNIFTSDTQVSSFGTFIMPIQPKIQVEGDFYVGIRQTSTTNVGFAYQREAPIRPDVFYFAAPLGSTDWVPFSPGYNFNINIQPRIQVANDLAAVEVVVPYDGQEIHYSETDSIIPQARFANYGLLAQSNVQCSLRIKNRFGQTVYLDQRLISLQPDSSILQSFDPFSLYGLGDYTVEAGVNLNIDSVKDNNNISSAFVLFKNYDIGMDLMFEPTAGDSFNMNEEGFWPQIKVTNYGRSDQNGIEFTARLLKDGIAVDSQTMFRSMGGNEGTILVFDSVFPPVDGKLIFEVYCVAPIDSFPQNDTLRVTVYGKKLRDIELLTILRPLPGQKFATGTQFRPFVEFRNQGLESQDSVLVKLRIEDSDEKEVYRDSIYKPLTFYSNTQALFKNFNCPNSPADFVCHAEVYIPMDQDRSNDSMSAAFSVVEGRDLQLLSLLQPEDEKIYNFNETTILPEVLVYNNGLNDIGTAPLILEIRDEQQSIVYRDSISTGALASGDSLYLQWKALDFDQAGFYTGTAYSAWKNENKPSSDDTIHFSYSVRYRLDVALSLNNPIVTQDTLGFNRTWLPELEIRNEGTDTSNDRVVTQIYKDGASLVWEDTSAWWELSMDEWLIYSSSSGAFSTDQPALYQMIAYPLGTDDYAENDTAVYSFWVLRTTDVSVDSSAWPVEWEALEIKKSHQPSVWISDQGIWPISDSFELFMEVWVAGNSIYTDNVKTLLEKGESKRVHFDSSLRFPENASAQLLVYSSYGDDVDLSNDSLEFNFNFSDKLSIPEKSEYGLRIYPNPGSDHIWLSADQTIERVSLYDALGKIIHSAEPRSSSSRIDLDLAAGTYTLIIQIGDRSVIRKYIRL